MVNLLPSVPNGSKIPVLGVTANSASESGVNCAVKFVKAFFLFVNLFNYYFIKIY